MVASEQDQLIQTTATWMRRRICGIDEFQVLRMVHGGLFWKAYDLQLLEHALQESSHLSVRSKAFVGLCLCILMPPGLSNPYVSGLAHFSKG